MLLKYRKSGFSDILLEEENMHANWPENMM